MYYIYKSCVNDPMITLEPLSESDLVCEVCGKSAKLITSALTEEDVAKAINDSNLQFSHYAQGEIENMFEYLHYDPIYGIVIRS